MYAGLHPQAAARHIGQVTSHCRTSAGDSLQHVAGDEVASSEHSCSVTGKKPAVAVVEQVVGRV